MPISQVILSRLKMNDPKLTELDLTRRYPQLTDSDMEQLAAALQNNKNLRVLILSEDGIGDNGVRILAQALLTTNVTTLDLSGNHISDEGARALFKVPSLTSLIIGGNDIGNEGITEIRENITIRTLVIDGNDIDDNGAAAFLTNSTITELVFDDDRINATLVEQIKRHIGDNVEKCAEQLASSLLVVLPLFPTDKREVFTQKLHRQLNAELEPSSGYSPKLYT